MNVSDIINKIFGKNRRLFLKKFFSKNGSWLILLVFVALVFFLIGFNYRMLARNYSDINIGLIEKKERTENIKKYRRLLDGVFVEEEKVNPPIAAVMVENLWEARPLSGLAQASLVWEAPTEGIIPRFLAIYPLDNEIKKIGPARSARPYYLDWAEEFNPLYAHVGGSPEALKKIPSYDLFDLNEFYNEWYFWRDGSRSMPHNVYTSTELLNKAIVNKNFSLDGNFESWKFKDDLAEEQRPQEGETVSFQYRDEAHRFTWQYNREKNDYLRYQAGALQKDTDGEQVRAKNVVFQFVESKVLDEIGRLYIKTVGDGKAVIFRDGQKIEGKWKKESKKGRTGFYDEAGEEVEFNAGASWIEVVSKGGVIE